MIPSDFIQTLLSRIDIVEVIDRYVPLKKAGVNHVACCPFHSERTPSFTVSQAKQFYHCFGCGAHGTAIRFLMEHGGKTFPEAVEELARDAGLTVPRVERPADAARRVQGHDLAAVLLAAARHYRAALKASPEAIAYLKRRGLTGEVAARFGIGYAPDAWQSLSAVFADYDSALLETAGLVMAAEGGKRYDRFRDRIMFPIHDARGQVIGFGGRVIGQGEPKYLNSPETPLFSKSRELYGLYLARRAIRETGRAVVVEGYMDVVALAQHGVDSAVATLGTATTPIHAQKLLRVTDNVVFCFDGDSAGRKAAWRALEHTLPAITDGKHVAFVFLPEGQDPDDFIRQRGKEGFEAQLAQAVPLSEFLLAELSARHPPVNDEGRSALMAAARPLLAEIGAPVLAALLRRRLAALSGLAETDLKRLLRIPAAASTRRTPWGANPAPADHPARRLPESSRRRAPSLMRELIQCLLLQPELARELALPPAANESEEAAALHALMAYCRDCPPPLTTPAVMQAFGDSEHEHVFVDALATATDHGLTLEQAQTALGEGVARLWQHAARNGQVDAAAGAPTQQTPEETERLRQLAIVRERAARRTGEAPAGDAEGGSTPGGSQTQDG